MCFTGARTVQCLDADSITGMRSLRYRSKICLARRKPSYARLAFGLNHRIQLRQINFQYAHVQKQNR